MFDILLFKRPVLIFFGLAVDKQRFSAFFNYHLYAKKKGLRIFSIFFLLVQSNIYMLLDNKVV